MMPMSTLTDAGAIHWGVMLAQGWKGELAGTRLGGELAGGPWTCPACQQTIIDHGPYGDLPEQQEGHAAECRRWTAEVADWQERHLAR